METLMSKGFGRVQREIDAIFTENPDSSFTVEELCQRIYSDWEKRHRVAVIRAAKAVTKRHPDIVCWRGENHGRPFVFFNHRNVMAYATARLKAEQLGGPLSDIGARRFLREHNRYAAMIAPGGYWWRHVQEWIAERDGDTAKMEELKALREAAERENAAMLAMLRRG